MSACQCGCGELLPDRGGPGRPIVYLDDTHRQRAHRARVRAGAATVTRSALIAELGGQRAAGGDLAELWRRIAAAPKC